MYSAFLLLSFLPCDVLSPFRNPLFFVHRSSKQTRPASSLSLPPPICDCNSAAPPNYTDRVIVPHFYTLPYKDCWRDRLWKLFIPLPSLRGTNHIVHTIYIFFTSLADLDFLSCFIIIHSGRMDEVQWSSIVSSSVCSLTTIYSQWEFIQPWARWLSCV